MSIDPPVPPVIDLACTVAEVAAWISARTKDDNGNELGTFTEDTRPTADQVQEAIDAQVVLLGEQVGGVGPDCADLARGAVAIGAAAQIELSYFPEQNRTDLSPYIYLRDRYAEALTGLTQCVMGNLPTPVDPDDPDDQNLRYGTIDCISGTVAAYYTGRIWPALPNPPAPTPPDPDDGD